MMDINDLMEQLNHPCCGRSASDIDVERFSADAILSELCAENAELKSELARLKAELAALPMTCNFRVGSVEEFMERYGTHKQVVGFMHRQNKNAEVQ